MSDHAAPGPSNEFIEEYRGFVEGLAGNLRRSLQIRIELEDLVGYGMEGLLQARERYEANSSNASFTSFAYYRVRGAMLDGCRRHGWKPRPRTQARMRQAEVLNDHFESHHEAHQALPPASSMEDSMNRAADMVGDALTILFVENSELEETLVQPRPSQERTASRSQLNDRLHEAMSVLTQEERVLVMRHHYQEESLAKIAEDMGGRNRSWGCRTHANAIRKLRNELVSRGLGPPDL